MKTLICILTLIGFNFNNPLHGKSTNKHNSDSLLFYKLLEDLRSKNPVFYNFEIEGRIVTIANDSNSSIYSSHILVPKISDDSFDSLFNSRIGNLCFYNFLVNQINSNDTFKTWVINLGLYQMTQKSIPEEYTLDYFKWQKCGRSTDIIYWKKEIARLLSRLQASPNYGY